MFGDTVELAAQAAEEIGLTGVTRKVYVEYVTTRFQGASPEYLLEWAERFHTGFAWQCSDHEGQALLRRMAGPAAESF